MPEVNLCRSDTLGGGEYVSEEIEVCGKENVFEALRKGMQRSVWTELGYRFPNSSNFVRGGEFRDNRGCID